MSAKKKSNYGADGGSPLPRLVRHAVDQWLVVMPHKAPIAHMWAVLGTHYSKDAAEEMAAHLRKSQDTSANWSQAIAVKGKASFSLPNAKEISTP